MSKNITDYENHQKIEKRVYIMKHVVGTLNLFLLIFGTTGHVVILIIMICNKDMRTVPNMYFLNLAISNMILSTSGFIWNSVEIYNEVKCKFLPFCSRMSVGLSAYSVAVLRFHRHRVTLNHFNGRASSPPTWRVAVATICGVWILATLFTIPSALSNFLCLEPPVPLKNTAYYKRVFEFELFVSCVFPLFSIAFSLFMTARHRVESSSLISEETKTPQMNTRKNAAKIVIGLNLVFLITYVPFHVIWAFSIFSAPHNVFSFNVMCHLRGLLEKYRTVFFYANT